MSIAGQDAAPYLAACVQTCTGIDPAQNIKDVSELICEAAGRGARLVATPEMTNVLDRDAKRLFSHLLPQDDNPHLAAFSELAQAQSIWLLIGSMAIRCGERQAVNRSYLFAPDGQLKAHYDKIHMFDVVLPSGESWRESAVYAPGERAVTAETELGKFGFGICYDIRFPRLYRTLAQSGAQVMFAPAAFTKDTGKAHWEVLIRARAIENGAFIIAPAQAGTHADGRTTYGHSMIVNPWGEVLVQADGHETGVFLAEIDSTRAIKARQSIPNLGLENTVKVYNFKT